MKGGTEYAKRIRRLYQKMVRQFGKPASGEPTDPIEQLVIGILAICSSPSQALTAFRKLSQQMVDFNELRVTPAMELAKLIGDSVPMAAEKSQQIVNALNEIRRRQDALDLSFLKQRGRREAREYLESLDGVNHSAAATVVLYSLGGHAIPVDNLTLYVLRKEELVAPTADIDETQRFLERHISAADSRAFATLLGRYVASRVPRVPMEKLGELLNPPATEVETPEDEPIPEIKTQQAATKTKPPSKKPAKSAVAAKNHKVGNGKKSAKSKVTSGMASAKKSQHQDARSQPPARKSAKTRTKRPARKDESASKR